MTEVKWMAVLQNAHENEKREDKHTEILIRPVMIRVNTFVPSSESKEAA